MGSRVRRSESSIAPDSFLTRFVLIPIRTMPFLVALALIDRRNHSVLTESSRDPKPNSDLDATAQKGGGKHTGDKSRSRKEKERWTMKKKHRKMIKMEIKDAVGIIAQVVVGLAVLSVVLDVVGFW